MGSQEISIGAECYFNNDMKATSQLFVDEKEMRCSGEFGRKKDLVPQVKDIANGDELEIQVKEIEGILTDEICVKYYLNDLYLGKQKFEKKFINKFKAIFTLGKKG